MKTLDRYILEKFQITKDSTPYTYHPKDKFELRKILKRRLSEDKNADLNNIDVSNITDMGYEGFENITGLFQSLNPCNIDISKWNMSNVTDTRGMFYDCKNFDCDLSEWDISNVKNMNIMFSGCENFKGEGLENWDVSHVENMNGMFRGCIQFTGKGLNKWNVSNIKNLRYMFKGCTSLKNKPSWYKLTL